MNKDELISCAQTPLKQLSNRVWRTYNGGALIDRWKNNQHEIDSDMPEEWVMSAISARGKNRPPNEGLSQVITPFGILSISELIKKDPELFLGKRMGTKIWNNWFLIKMLDASERLTMQVHPDKLYAREMFDSAFGKTESWYILGGREINGEKSCIYLGFKEGVTEEKWSELFYKQDINGMLNCLHRFEVSTGDAFIIYGVFLMLLEAVVF